MSPSRKAPKRSGCTSCWRRSSIGSSCAIGAGAPRQGNKGDQVDADQLSELLRRGALRAVYHGSADRATLKELTRTYRNLVEDATRVMLRLKALFRARAIPTQGTNVYQARARGQWLAQLGERGARFRAQALYAELDVLRKLRPRAKAAMVTEARRDPAWPVLRTIPFLGPVRVALLLATMQTPWRFRTKRHLWAYAGLAVVTRSSADYTIIAGQAVRRRRPPMTRGLNQNHNRVLKDVFKGAATAATGRPGPLQDFYHSVMARGTREELARLTLLRVLRRGLELGECLGLTADRANYDCETVLRTLVPVPGAAAEGNVLAAASRYRR